MEHLAEDENGEDRAEDRHEIDEEVGPVGADRIDAPDIERLRDERREDRRIERSARALDIGQDRVSEGVFRDGEGDRGEEGRKREAEDRRLPGKLRLDAKRHRIAAVDQDADQHDRIAEIERKRQELCRVSMGCGEKHAGEGEHEAGHLVAGDAGPEDQEIEDEDDQRHRGLLDGDVDGRREIQRRIERGVEHREPAGAKQKERGEARADGRPVRLEMLHREGRHEERREGPADECQEHRRDMARRKLSGDRVAAPKQHREREQNIRTGENANHGAASGEGDTAARRLKKAAGRAKMPRRKGQTRLEAQIPP